MFKFSILLLFLLPIIGNSQDVIVKTNQEEVNSKIIEITENKIKYKFFNRQDGPIYNINKNEVFMIIYEDGNKEYYTPNTKTKKQSNKTDIEAETISQQTKPINNTVSQEIPLKVDEKIYYPSLGKINFGFGNDSGPSDLTTLGFGIIANYPFSKNGKGNFEFEAGAYFLFSSGSILGQEVSTNTYGFAVAGSYGYFVTKGLKLSGGVGFSYLAGTSNVGNLESDISEFDLFYHFDADYMFTKGFGVNLRYDQILGINFGVTFGI